MSKQSQLLAALLTLLPLASSLPAGAPTGRPPANRQALAAAFFAKAIFNLTTTRQLLDRLRHDPQLRRLCGWNSRAQIPAEATFSRAFAEFSASGLPHKLHQALVHKTLADRRFQFLARDSTAIEARERLPQDRVPAHSKKKNKPPRKRGSHPRAKATARGSLLQRQPHQNLEQMIADLPKQCSLGVKTSSKGHQQYWRGYKLHWDVVDGGRFPVSCLLTGASVHDSQVALPLMEMSRKHVHWKCDVMDSAYDAKAIRQRCTQLGHQALIKPVKRWKQRHALHAFTLEQQEQFKVRTIVEQLNGRLKDEFGGRIIYVRGGLKIGAHLMFGVVALTVDQLLRTVV